MVVKTLLNQIQRGQYAQVITYDDMHNIRYTFLEYNKTRHKFFLRGSLTSVHRKTINKREAELLLARTIYAHRRIERREL